MDFIRKEISITDIDLTDTSFQFDTQRFADATLIQSIDENGLLFPVLVRETDRSFQLLNGFKRIHAADVLDMSHIPALVFPQHLSDISCIKAILATQSHALSVLAVGKILRCLKSLSTNDDEFYTMAFDILSLSNRSQVTDYLLVTDLSEEMQQLVQEGIISLPIVSLFTQKIPADAHSLVADLFRKYKFSFQKQREIITNLHEIAKLQNSSIKELLTSSDFRCLMDTENDKGTLATSIRNYFRKKRYPTLTAAKETFKQNCKELRLPESLHLYPPEGFEGNTFRIQFTFTNKEELSRILDHLLDMKDNPALTSILQKF